MSPIGTTQGSCTVNLKAPPFAGISWTISSEWKPGNAEKQAAWEMYVELITRIASVQLAEDCGFLREALTSLHELFPITREILKRYGPDVAKSNRSLWRRIRRQESDTTLAEIAVFILNAVLRPFLSKWHPELEAWEAQRKESTSHGEHERNWPRNAEFRKELEQVRIELQKYIECLAKVSGVPPSFALRTTTTLDSKARA